jgi:hypothetical protein
MKKVAFLLAVAVCTSVASAATWEIQVNGNDHQEGQLLSVGDIVRVALYEPVEGYGGFGDFTVNVSFGQYIDDSLDFHLGPWVLPPAGSVTPVGPGFDVYAAGSGFPSPTGEIMWFEFHLHGMVDGTQIVISHDLGSWNNVFPPNALEDVVLEHYIPEPITIGLLGFGALGLMRRRR